MVQIVGHLTVDGLGERYRFARDATEARHFQAIWLLAQGRGVSEVAGLLAFVERWVELLVRPKAGQTEVVRYNREGPDALGDLRRNNGRAANVLTPDLLVALAERVKTPPDDGGMWSGPKVARWMAGHHKLEHVHPQRGWDALKRIRWSIQVPRPRNPKAATPDEQAAYKKTRRRGGRGEPRLP